MVSLPDADKVKKLISELFTVNSKRGWILMKYSNPTTVVLEDYGTGDGITEIRNRLRDNEMQYALLRIPLSDQGQHVAAGSEIQVVTVRDVFIAWTGPKVGLMEKGKKKSHLGALQALLSPAHAQLECVNKQNFTEANVVYKSDPKAGSHIIE